MGPAGTRRPKAAEIVLWTICPAGPESLRDRRTRERALPESRCSVYIYGRRGENLPPRAAIFERNVKFAKRAKKCEKPLDFFVKMITIVYS